MILFLAAVLSGTVSTVTILMFWAGIILVVVGAWRAQQVNARTRQRSKA